MIRWWLFQANPERFRLSSALRELRDFTYQVNQYRQEMHAGDRVFLYETGPSGGVMALGHLRDEPKIGRSEDAANKYWTVLAESDVGDRWRVGVHVDFLIRPPIARSTLKSNLGTADLPNIRFAQATNYPVTPAAAAELLVIALDRSVRHVTDDAPKGASK